jgi:hypothetical protein
MLDGETHCEARQASPFHLLHKSTGKRVFEFSFFSLALQA